MHPLSIFPELFNYEIFGALLLRVVVGLFVIYLGLERRKKVFNWSSIFYFVSGLLLVLGLYTQPAGILAILVLKFDFYLNYWKNKLTSPIKVESYFMYAMAIVILLCLLVTGPGAFAFDLPL